MKAVKARRLVPGDHVGIISPSWGGAAVFPHRVDLGVRALERLGLRVKLGRRTRFWPSWDGCILFVETSEMAPPPAVVDGMLMDYQNMGVFDRIGALLVGRPMRYTDLQRQQLRDVVLERTAGFDFPVVMDMDFGHTAPQFTLPIGCRARVDATAERFEILEPAVE